MHQDLVTDGDDGTWLLVVDGSRFSMGFSTRLAKITSANLGRTWSTHNLINLWIPDIGGLYYLICTVWGVIGVVTEHVSLSMQGDGMNCAPQNAPLTLTSRSLKVPNFSDYELIKYVWHTSRIDWEENLQENAIFDDTYYGFWKKTSEIRMRQEMLMHGFSPTHNCTFGMLEPFRRIDRRFIVFYNRSHTKLQGFIKLFAAMCSCKTSAPYDYCI